MSIAEEGKNINSRVEGRSKKPLLLRLTSLTPWFIPLAAVLSAASWIGLGILWGKVNAPAPIEIDCSDEVLKGLEASTTTPIEPVKVPKKSSASTKRQPKPTYVKNAKKL